ncbi:hypothetical protein C8R45DRAFT_1064835 [Mycena sanguinolenta]|nr:hypothetical protein C8R45DRAFT_1064835 [Mycena sanguinolenta]
MTRLEPDSPIPAEHSNPVVEDILSGKQKIVSHVGASQYQGGGIASCGLAGLNFVRVVLGRIESGLDGGSLLEDVLSRRTGEEVISICSRWASNVHLEVEDIFKAMPVFERSLKLISSSYGEPSFKRFRAVLSELQSLPSYAAVLITRPPEIITCFKLSINSQDVFIIFDSHPRTEYPNGAGLIVNTSLDVTARRLDNLLTVDSRLLADRSLQWQSQLLANFSGHFFVAKDGVKNSVEELTQAVLESSLVALGLQAEILDLKFQNSSLSRERQSLETDLAQLKEKYGMAQRKMDESKRPCAQCNPKKSPSSARRSTSNYHDSRPTAGPSRHGTFDASPSSHLNALEYFSSPANIVRSRRSLDSESMDYLVATQLQMSVDDANHEHWRSVVSPRTSYAQAVTSSSKDVPMDDHAVALQLQMDWDREERNDALKAQAMQHEFEQEDAQLVAQRAVLRKEAQVLFECGICFDKCPEDYVSRIADCTHAFCRECMRSYVVSKLQDKLYPIFCPMCVTDQARVEPGAITDDLAQTLGLDDKDYQILQELQIASMSILLHCRQCKESVFVDRAEYEAEQILVCPLPRCNYAWCKACQQTIPMDGPKHSCDGSSELEHLMKRRGWKHCPGCKTPFQKSDGCNHMTCMSPGCNTHFCYICGDSIVRSALPRAIRAAVSAHYRRCRLFEDVPER